MFFWKMTDEERAAKAEAKRRKLQERAEALEAEKQRARERAEKAAEFERQQHRIKVLSATMHGRAQLALENGDKFFHATRVISATDAQVYAMMGAMSSSKEVDKTSSGAHSNAGGVFSTLDEVRNWLKDDKELPLAQALEAIEHIGWKLINSGWIYRMTHSQSRDKFMASGQDEAFGGEIVGIYLFRRRK
ncbi:MAG: hypothetical protein OXU44_06485 [Gammaproteobacteria bacterium]|nr:hypothetical protein [Gammaproteobacteria bacterium]